MRGRHASSLTVWVCSEREREREEIKREREKEKIWVILTE